MASNCACFTAVRMATEDLYVSPKHVRVRFEFANDTDRDVETVVAFPLPDIDVGNYWTVALGRITGDPVNFVGFEVKVDGKWQLGNDTAADILTGAAQVGDEVRPN